MSSPFAAAAGVRQGQRGAAARSRARARPGRASCAPRRTEVECARGGRGSPPPRRPRPSC